MHLNIKILYILLAFVACNFADEQSDADLACSPSTRPVVLTANEGYIESQNYPNNYENNANCQWLLQPSNVGSEQMLYIEIVEFNTEALDDLVFYEGDSTSGDVIFDLDGFVFTGTAYPANTDVVTVHFYSDYIVTDTGFRIRYYLGDKSPAQEMSKLACSATTMPAVLNSTTDLVESLNYPGNYPDNECEWLIQPSIDTTGLYLSIISYDTMDYLYVYDKNRPSGNYIEYWYGLQLPGTSVLGTSGSFYLTFYPNYHNVADGFQLVYFPEDEACLTGTPSTITATSTPQDLTSPGYPYIIPNILNCRWLIRAEDENQRVLLTVQEFDLHESRNCEDEYLEIYDGDTVDALLLGRYCGASAIGSIPSTTNAMQLYLQTRNTEASEGKIGFSIVYSSGQKNV